MSTLCLRRNPAVPNSLFDQRLVETTLPRNFEPNTVSPSYSSPSEVRGELCTGWEIMKSGTANAACTINESDRISPILDRLLQDPGVVPLAGVPFHGARHKADARLALMVCGGRSPVEELGETALDRTRLDNPQRPHHNPSPWNGAHPLGRAATLHRPTVEHAWLGPGSGLRGP